MTHFSPKFNVKLNQSNNTSEHGLPAVNGNTLTQGMTIKKENLFAQCWVLVLKLRKSIYHFNKTMRSKGSKNDL